MTTPYEIHHGDLLHFLPTLPTSSFDLLLTDPPYCSGGMHRGSRTQTTKQKYCDSTTATYGAYEDFEGDQRDQRGYQLWVAQWVSLCRPLLKPGASFAIFTDWRQIAATFDAIQSGGLVVRGVAVWDKGGGARPQKSRPAAQAEFIVWGSRGKMPIRDDVPCLPGVFMAPTVRTKDRAHIAQKPLEVMRELVKLCPPEGRVLDPFAGSGSTLVAAIESGREVVGCEVSRRWADVASERCEAAANNAARASAAQPSLF